MDALTILNGLKSQIDLAIQVLTANQHVAAAVVETAGQAPKRKRKMSPEARAAAGLRLEQYRAQKAGQTLEQYRKARQAAKDALAKGANPTPVAASAAK